MRALIGKEDFLVDELNPRAIINIGPPCIKNKMAEIDIKKVSLDEEQLRDLYYKKRKKNFGVIDKKLRISFWKEYDKAVKHNRRMEVANIVDGVCSYIYFTRSFVKNEYRLCFMLIPTPNYEIELEYMQQEMLDKIKTILSLPVLLGKKKNKINSEVIKTISRFYALIDNRLHGAATQRIETKNLNVNMNNEVQSEDQSFYSMKMDELNKKLKQLQKETLSVEKAEIHVIEDGRDSGEEEGHSGSDQTSGSEEETDVLPSSPIQPEVLQVEQGVFRDDE